MSLTEANWHHSHQSEAQAHAILGQLAGLVFPEGQLISQLPFPTADAAFQLWTRRKTQAAFLLSTKVIDQNFILTLLQAFDGLRLKTGNGNSEAGLQPYCDLHLFGLQFHESFASKLKFLKFNCHLYSVSISRSNERDIVLIRDFRQASSQGSEKQSAAPIPMPEPSPEPQLDLPVIQPLTSEEISDFAALSRELRKMHEPQ